MIKLPVIGYKTLWNYEKYFTKFCHAPGCSNWEVCPQKCPCKLERKFELNLETAMAWEIKISLGEVFKTLKDIEYLNENHFIQETVQSSFEDTKEDIVEIGELNDQFYSYLHLLKYHVPQDRYKLPPHSIEGRRLRLFRKLENLRSYIYDLHERLERWINRIENPI